MADIKLDEIDYKILGLLQENSKISNIKIAKEIGLTPPSTLERVRKLEENGIIEGYYTRFNKEKLDYKITVFIAVTLNLHNKGNIDEFVSKIKNIPKVIEYYHTTGKFDYLLKVYAKDISDLQNFLINDLTTSSGISKAETLLILEEKKFGIDFESIKNENLK